MIDTRSLRLTTYKTASPDITMGISNKLNLLNLGRSYGLGNQIIELKLRDGKEKSKLGYPDLNS